MKKLERPITIAEAAALAGVPRSTMQRRLHAANEAAGGKLLARLGAKRRWYVTRSTLAKCLPSLLPKRGIDEDEAVVLRERIIALENRLRAHGRVIRELVAAARREVQ